MKHSNTTKILLAVVLCIPLGATYAENKVERSPLEIGASFDLGQIVNGKNSLTLTETTPKLQAKFPTDIQGLMIQRTGVYLNQITTINDRLLIKVGVGGLFFYGFPENENPQSRSTRFGPGVGQAQGLYKIGDVENPSWQIQFGYFPFKYNPDAKNLGEYLFRCGTYPGYQVTGGYSIVNSAGYMASGMRINGNFLGGKLSADGNIFIERDIEPAYDISPGLVLTFRPSQAFEIGAGAVWAHLLPVNPSKVKSRSTKILGDSLAILKDPVTQQPRDTAGLSTFTFQGTKLMARASFNLGSILNSPFIGKEGLKFYTEVALLGVKNYPYFYTDRMTRMPILFGLNLPTFNFFEVFAVEMEYRKWDFPNSTLQSFENSEPIWRIPDVTYQDTTRRQFQPDPLTRDTSDYINVIPGNSHMYSPSLSPAEAAARAQAFLDESGLGINNDPSQNIASKKGNLKWTVYVKKQMVAGVNLYLQVASDHMRGIRFDDNTLDREVITQEPDQWYYLFRLEFGI